MVAGGTAGAAGCVNARDGYDDYKDRLIDADTREIDAPIVSSLPDVTGDWYMVDEIQLGEPKRVHFISTFDFRAVTENTGELDWSGQALDYETLEPVGDPFVAEDVPVDNTGTADMTMVGTLHARANSITGAPAEVDAIVHVQLRSIDFICGELTGEAGTLAVDGINTFAGTRITGDELPPAVVSCDDEPSE
jgi:hypothetical protein